MTGPPVIRRRALAKVNLTLDVLGRRADGWHDLESLVAFAGVGDRLTFEPGGDWRLEVVGAGAEGCGPPEANLVLAGAHALARRVPDLASGRFVLFKRLPVAAGLGGGSADAAAALRALAAAHGLADDDDRLIAAARAVGADVPVCLAQRARFMRGVGERLGPPVALPQLFILLANPGVSLPTPSVFAALSLAPGERHAAATSAAGDAPVTLEAIRRGRNDLEAPARRLAPAIGGLIERLARTPGAECARMSGSGATCFALFSDRRAASAARAAITTERPDWWTAAAGLR